MSSINQPLKYLWTAVYDDGSMLEQPADDRSREHDESQDWNPSAFRDIDHEHLVAFVLRGVEAEGAPFYTVNLTDGSFTINGVPFILHDQNYIPPRKLDLIYYREVRKEFKPGEDEPFNEYVNRYFLGWKDGEGVQHVIGVT